MSSVQELERQSNVLVICHEVGDAVLCKTFILCTQASMYMAKKRCMLAIIKPELVLVSLA